MNIREKNECKFTNIYGLAREHSALLASLSSNLGLDKPSHTCSLTRACTASIHKVRV